MSVQATTGSGQEIPVEPSTGTVTVEIDRDSVGMGDDSFAPHTYRREVPSNCSIGRLLLDAIERLPFVAGDLAWHMRALVHGVPEAHPVLIFSVFVAFDAGTGERSYAVSAADPWRIVAPTAPVGRSLIPDSDGVRRISFHYASGSGLVSERQFRRVVGADEGS